MSVDLTPEKGSIFRGQIKVTTEQEFQGSQPGKVYVIINVDEQVNFFGNFVTYTMKANRQAPIDVVNGHLLLKRVS